MRIDFGQIFHGCRNKFINITNKSNESSNFTFSPYIYSSLNPFNCKRNRKTNNVEEKRRNRDDGFDVMVERKAWRIVLDSDFIQFAYIAHRSHRVASVFIHFHSQLQIEMCITPLCFVRASDGIFVKEKLLQQPSARSFPLRRRLFVVLSLCARSLIFFGMNVETLSIEFHFLDAIRLFHYRLRAWWKNNASNMKLIVFFIHRLVGVFAYMSRPVVVFGLYLFGLAGMRLVSINTIRRVYCFGWRDFFFICAHIWMWRDIGPQIGVQQRLLCRKK